MKLEPLSIATANLQMVEVNERKMTIAVFKQLPEIQLRSPLHKYGMTEGNASDEWWAEKDYLVGEERQGFWVLGWVNYHPDGCAKDPEHRHGLCLPSNAHEDGPRALMPGKIAEIAAVRKLYRCIAYKEQDSMIWDLMTREVGQIFIAS